MEQRSKNISPSGNLPSLRQQSFLEVFSIGSYINKEVRSRVATAFIGAGIFGFVLMIPWINDVLLIFANSLGLGAVVLSRFGTKV